MKGSKTRSNKLLAMVLVLAMVFGAASTLAEANVASAYAAVEGKEIWTPAAKVEKGLVTLNKKVTARPEANAWDIELEFETTKLMQSASVENVLSAMVVDTINQTYFNVPGKDAFKATLSKGGDSGTFKVGNGQMQWFPKDGKVEAGVKVTIKYALTLKELPKAGVYHNVLTSDAVLQYKVVSGSGESDYGASEYDSEYGSDYGKKKDPKESDYGKSGYGKSGYGKSGYGKSGYGDSGYKDSGYSDYKDSGYCEPKDVMAKLKFPTTKVGFEVGETKVEWVKNGQTTPIKSSSSKRVITDFDGMISKQAGVAVYPSEIELPLAMQQWVLNSVRYTILAENAVDGSGMKTTPIVTSGLAFDDSLKTEQEGTFTVRQLTGETVLKYLYDGQEIAELTVSKLTLNGEDAAVVTGAEYEIDIFEVGKEEPYTTVKLSGGKSATVVLPAGVAFYAKEKQPGDVASGYAYTGTSNGFEGGEADTGLESQEFTPEKGESVQLVYTNYYELLPDTISFEIAKTVVVDASTDPALPELYTFEVTYDGADAPLTYSVAPEGTTTVTLPAGAKNIVVREVTSAAQIAGYSLSVASSFYHTYWRLNQDWSSESYQFVAGATSTALDEMLGELNGIVFQNTYTAGGGLTDFDPVVIPLGAPEIPLGPPMTGGEVTAYGWAFVILALAAALGIVAIRKQRA